MIELNTCTPGSDWNSSRSHVRRCSSGGASNDLQGVQGSADHRHRRPGDDRRFDERSGGVAPEHRLHDLERLVGRAVQHHQRRSVTDQLGPPVGVGDARFGGDVGGDGVLVAFEAEQVLGPGHRDEDPFVIAGGHRFRRR